jgi:CheY-like chemotaxis protein/anti-sigma regulatory factor (Ser/Thr protein kinase)
MATPCAESLDRGRFPVASDSAKRVLIVEDEPPMRKLLVKIFSKVGEYQVESAEDGNKAIEACEAAGGFDLVISDIQMPGLSGVELVDMIIERWPRTAIVMLSALRTDDAVVKCLQRGALDYLTKPIDVARLLRTAERALGRREQMPEDIGRLDVKSDVRGWVELTVPTHFEYVERFQRFVQQLYETSLSREEVEDIRVAIDEIGQNAVEWGNREDVSKRIRLSYCLFKDRVVFKIEDEGEGFDVEKLKDPSRDPMAHIMERMADGKRMGGYGIFMSKSIMDDIQYSERGNVVIMTKLLSPAGNPDTSSDGADAGDAEPAGESS